MNNQTIVYVNYAPYENSGHILDFLKERFYRVIVFTFNFHSLGKHQKPSNLTVYEHKKPVSRRALFALSRPLPAYVVFFLLPIRSVINTLQIIVYTSDVARRYGPPEYYFTVNAFTAWVGNLLRTFGLVKQTIFWVWDYYPPHHKDWVVMFMRKLYWQFDKDGQRSNRIIFLNRRLIELRERIGTLPRGGRYPMVAIGTRPVESIGKRDRKRPSFCFVGVVKQSQGLDMALDAVPLLIKKYKGLRLEIIGSGPDEEYFRKRATNRNIPIAFHGYVEDEHKISTLLQKQHIGLALYKPDASNVSYFGDPSKIKDYLSFGIPVITTGVFVFSKEIVEAKAGIIVEYGNKEALAKAVRIILNDYQSFSKNALALSKKYNYRKIYPALFPSLQ